MTYMELYRGLNKEAGMKKEALIGIGSFNPRALLQLAKAIRSKSNPIGRAALGLKRPSGSQRDVADTVLQNLQSYMDWNAEHFKGDTLGLLFRRAVANPKKYKGAYDIISIATERPDYISATQQIAKKTGIPKNFLASLITRQL